MNTAPIRVLLVDDSMLALNVMSRLLAQAPGIQVVGKAQNGIEALNLIPFVKPTIICTDYLMPQMDGLELTKRVMLAFPMPILVVSSFLDIKSSKEVFSLLDAGAIDCIQKPNAFSNSIDNKAFIDKIRIISKVFIFNKGQKSPDFLHTTLPKNHKIHSSYEVIIIGASTGGPKALGTILPALPKHFPIPILCVQHISKGFLEGFVAWLKSQCQLNVKIIKDEEKIEQGHIYLPKEGTHLIIDKEKQLKISFSPPIRGHRPSINVTMESAAKQFGKEVIGILLTGMGDDGAQGMKTISATGGLTIVQNQASCAVFGMPKAALEIGAVNLVMDPPTIASFLIKTLSCDGKTES